jgi:prepilin-type processing-associated H-X9-DG protein
MKIAFPRLRLNHGMTRMDVLGIAAAGVLIFVVVAGIWMASEKRRIWVCASHQKALGQAFAGYASDHNDELPPAVLETTNMSTSWDKEIAPYLTPKLPNQSSAEAQKKHQDKVTTIFKCPSDREPRGGAAPRSYSMPIYDVNRVGWPPKADSLGGLGLYLDSKTLAKARGSDAAESSDYLPAIKTSMVAAPADTALLVERISILNALWATRFACIASDKEQFGAKTFSTIEFHGGKMNYLMMDGHVELLWPIQSGGHMGTGDQGLWTIRSGD